MPISRDPALDRVGDQREEAQAGEQHRYQCENRENVPDALFRPVQLVEVLVDKGKSEGKVGEMTRPDLFHVFQRARRVFGLDPDRHELTAAVHDREGFDGQMQ